MGGEWRVGCAAIRVEVPRSLRSPRDDRRGRVRRWEGRAALRVEVPFDSVPRCRTSLRTGSSAALGMTDGGRQRPGNHEGTKGEAAGHEGPALRGRGKGTATDGGDRCARPTGRGTATADRLGTCPTRNGHGRRAWECPPYNGRGKPLPNRTATARRAQAYPAYIRGVPSLREGVCWGMDPSASVGMTDRGGGLGAGRWVLRFHSTPSCIAGLRSGQAPRLRSG